MSKILERLAPFMAGSALALSVATAQEVGTRPADPADTRSVDAILAAVYDVISGPAGGRDWDRMRSLFVREARLITVGLSPEGEFTKQAMSLEDFIAQAGPYLEQNGFYEREIHRVTDRYAYVAHVFSTYASFHAADDVEPFSRGINSFQLMHDGDRWWVVTIFWESETPGKPIPEKYLP